MENYCFHLGIGFKSLFLVKIQPYIYNNGYRIRFNEIPPPHVNIGYIIPKWIEDRPCTTQLKEIYGC